MLKRKWFSSLVLIFTLAIFTGCSSESSDSQANDAGSDESVTTIEFWHGHTGPDGKVMEELVRAFEEEHPEIKVNTQSLPWGELFTKAQLAIKGGSGPDMMSIPIDRVFLYKDTLVKPVDDLINESAIKAENFDQYLWDKTFFDGKQYGVPLDSHPYVLYYRPDLVEKAGLEPLPKDRPLTREEFEEYATALTTDSQKGFAYKQTAHHTWWDIWSLFLQAGGSLYNEDQTESNFDSPATKKAIDYLLYLKNDLQVTPPTNLDWTTAFSYFNDGQVAMLMHGSWLIPGLEESGTEYDTAMVPQFFEEDYGVFANMHTLTLTRSDEAKAKAAFTFIEWVEQEENATAWGVGSGNVPANLAARENYSEEDKLKPLAEMANLMKGKLFMNPYTEKDETILYKHMVPNLEGIYNETISIEEGIKKIDEAINQELQ
ncbi:ABC transporter substrate-binding protein [Bacillus sp. Marseille-P3661]|uniref:ABC transporter substrate-binding protein n=1 Tax=Bacillus sp. Marseille-P3661 TaxID=1936234 RepID=UPI000C852ED5|nr:ABC transporter substrate-binding protein [Bacillus sp. Marseille-P3661]